MCRLDAMKALPLLLLLFYSVKVCAQNLVPNGSFEDYTDCPSTLFDLGFTQWMTREIGREGSGGMKEVVIARRNDEAICRN